MVERSRVGNIIHEDGAMRAATIRGQDEPEAVLAAKVPDLEVDRVAIYRQALDHELDAERDSTVVMELPADIPIHERGFPDTAVPSDDELKRVANVISLHL